MLTCHWICLYFIREFHENVIFELRIKEVNNFYYPCSESKGGN